MSVFSKSTSVSGKYKELVISNNCFCDPNTGEQIDVIGQLYNVYGDNIFSLSTSYKANEEIELDEENDD